jgi:hypothetical protein
MSGGMDVDRPPWWLVEPARPTDAKSLAAFDRLLVEARSAGPEKPLAYDLPFPKWQFLSHVADRGDIVLHGSGQPDITTFQPRQSGDLRAFGAEKAIFAASDGIWAIFFAILDRSRYTSTLVNACLRVRNGAERGFFFSLERGELAAGPWRDGTVYLLPAVGFQHDAPIRLGGLDLWPAQLASTSTVAPIARLHVTPRDFPLLGNVRGHDEEQLRMEAAARPEDFPWLTPDADR